MGELADRLDNIRVRVSAPGADIAAELRNRGEFGLYFGESVYEFIDERFLEHSLASMARLLYAGWQREYMDAISDTNLNVLPEDQHDFNFRDEVRAIEASGQSSDGRITISAVGMDDFTVQIKSGTVRELGEAEFATGASEAASLLLQRHEEQATQLQMQYYW